MDMYGAHFNKHLYEFAVSMMTDRSGGRVQPSGKEQVAEFLRSNGIALKNNKGYDAAFVHAMFMADYWGSSMTSDRQLAMAIADYLDDKDGNPTKAFDHFVIDCRRKGETIYWEEML